MTLNETFKDWLTTFWKVLTSPTPKTFNAESQKAEGKFRSAVAWLVFFTIYIFIFFTLLLGQVFLTGLIGLLLVIPLTVILFSSAMNFMYQRVFKGKQYMFDKLVYLNTAILVSVQFLFVPFSIFVLVPTAAITFNAIVADVVLFYQLILMMIAFQSISDLRFWQAATAVTVSVLAAGIALLCVIPVLWSTIGGVNAIPR